LTTVPNWAVAALNEARRIPRENYEVAYGMCLDIAADEHEDQELMTYLLKHAVIDGPVEDDEVPF